MDNRGNFIHTYKQSFSLPPPIINYVAKTPKFDPELYYKLYFCCKYFYNKAKILPCSSITCFRSEIHIFYIDFYYTRIRKITKKDLFSSNFKLYCFDSLFIRDNSIPLYSLIRQRHIFTPINLTIDYQILFFDEFINLTSNTEYLKMDRTTVLNFNGGVVPLEKLIKYVPNVYNFEYCLKMNDTKRHYISKTTTKLAKMEKSTKFENFTLHFVPETFGPKNFAIFVLKNSVNYCRSKWFINFATNVPQRLINEFRAIVNKVIELRWIRKETKPKLKLNGNW